MELTIDRKSTENKNIKKHPNKVPSTEQFRFSSSSSLVNAHRAALFIHDCP